MDLAHQLLELLLPALGVGLGELAARRRRARSAARAARPCRRRGRRATPGPVPSACGDAAHAERVEPAGVDDAPARRRRSARGSAACALGLGERGRAAAPGRFGERARTRTPFYGTNAVRHLRTVFVGAPGRTRPTADEHDRRADHRDLRGGRRRRPRPRRARTRGRRRPRCRRHATPLVCLRRGARRRPDRRRRRRAARDAPARAHLARRARRAHGGRGHDRRDHARRHARLRGLRRAPRGRPGRRALRARRPAACAAAAPAGSRSARSCWSWPAPTSRCVPDNFDFNLVGPDWLSVLCFTALALFQGALVGRARRAALARRAVGASPARACCSSAASRSRPSCSSRCRSSPSNVADILSG